MQNKYFKTYYQEKMKESLSVKDKLSSIFYQAKLEDENIQLIFFPWELENIQLLLSYNDTETTAHSYMIVNNRSYEIPMKLYLEEELREMEINKLLKDGINTVEEMEQLEHLRRIVNPILKSCNLKTENILSNYISLLVDYREMTLKKQMQELQTKKGVITPFVYKLLSAKSS